MLSPSWHLVPAAIGCAAVQEPEAQRWNDPLTQFHMPSEVQAPDLIPAVEPEPEPEPDPVPAPAVVVGAAAFVVEVIIVVGCWLIIVVGLAAAPLDEALGLTVTNTPPAD